MKFFNVCILTILTLFIFNSSIAQTQLNLLGQLTYTDGLNDIWGYAANGNEYALVGLVTGVSIVNVTNPAAPVETQFIPHVSTTWRDIKTWGTKAYVINEAQDGLMIIDLSTLPGTCSYTFWSGAAQNYMYNGSPFVHTDAHNIFIDEFGYGYLFGGNSPGGGGVLIIDIASNPSNPQIVGHYDVAYCHDGYVRNNLLYTAEIYNGWFAIVDVSNKANIGAAQVLGTGPTTQSFTHNVWISGDSNYAFTTDENSGAEVGSFDISNPSNIQRLTGYRSNPGSGVIPHNTHVKNDYLYTSYYADGLTVVCAQNPRILTEVGYYDTSPANTGSGFAGCWGAYPFLPSGKILASDRQNGLHILDNNYGCSANIEGIVTDQATGNPIINASVIFNPAIYAASSDLSGYYGVGTANNNGTYTITVSAPGYQTYTTTVNLVDCQTTNLDVVLSTGSCPSVSFNTLPNTYSSNSPINLSGTPAGGTFSGPGVIFNAFNPSLSGAGYHTITYTYNDGNGCSGTSTQNILVFTVNYNFVNYNLGTISPKEYVVEGNPNLAIQNVYPVPSNHLVTVELQSTEEAASTLFIYNMNGQLLKTQAVYLLEGLNHIPIDLGVMKKGNYQVKMQLVDQPAVIEFQIAK